MNCNPLFHSLRRLRHNTGHLVYGEFCASEKSSSCERATGAATESTLSRLCLQPAEPTGGARGGGETSQRLRQI